MLEGFFLRPERGPKPAHKLASIDWGRNKQPPLIINPTLEEKWMGPEGGGGEGFLLDLGIRLIRAFSSMPALPGTGSQGVPFMESLRFTPRRSY